MPLLTVPNWSIGRERTVLRQVYDLLDAAPVTVHYAEADIDHNRTVTAFSGEPAKVRETLLEVARMILPCINLNRHTGVHPRIGGLDVCPFIPLGGPADPAELHTFIESFAADFAAEFEVPVYLYEKSAHPGKPSALPKFRKGGFGALQGVELQPDYGPNTAHPYLGATVIGHRDFLLAMNVNFPVESSNPAATATVENVASTIRYKRREGEANLAGVRALGFDLAAQSIAQVSINVTDPDTVDLDGLIEFIMQEAAKGDLTEGYVQLIGVIRDIDVERSVKIAARAAQVVPTRQAGDWREDWA